MTEHRERMIDSDLEHALVDLGRHLAYPPCPDMARAIGDGLEREHATLRLPAWRLTGLRRAAMGGVVAVLLAGILLMASPGARAAVARWLGLPGVRITVGGPVLRPGRMGGGLQLGHRTTLADAQKSAPYHILVPSLGAPDEVYADNSVPGGRVSLIYHARRGLPRAATTEAGLLVIEFQGSARQVWLGKRVGWRALPLTLSVGGHPGYWVRGAHLEFLYRTVSGRRFIDLPRLAGNTLLWERNGLTLRLESALSQRSALNIATSMH